jgi:hypothetical protein
VDGQERLRTETLRDDGDVGVADAGVQTARARQPVAVAGAGLAVAVGTPPSPAPAAAAGALVAVASEQALAHLQEDMAILNTPFS